MKAPAAAWDPLIAFYEANQHSEKLEDWPRGNTYVNSWEVPSYMVSLENRSLRGGLAVKQKVWDGVKPILEEWTGQKLEPTSLYGIRIYKDGAILSTHVDRLPLVTSAIIQVAQDLDDPWPIEVYDHNGKAYNVTMEPGDMVLYESHTVLHGRPFPLRGRKYANVFVHFQPIGHDAINQQDQQERNAHPKKPVNNRIRNLFGKSSSVSATKAYIGGHEQSNHEEEHVKEHLDRIDAENSALLAEQMRLAQEKEEAALDAKAEALKAALDAELAEENRDHSGIDMSNGSGVKVEANFVDSEAASAKDMTEQRSPLSASTHDASAPFGRTFTPIDPEHFDRKEKMDRPATGSPEYMEVMRNAAAAGDTELLRDLLDKHHIHLLTVGDENDWQLLHEAVRGGHLGTVKMLVELGADLTSTVAEGGNALWIARSRLEVGHPIIKYLEEIGAPE
eukprot:CAMPEP_0170377754 /NCGR_PEP_ID=MMETSP0117_2-20130122/12440_1 /TAXON_ID=400756 /ORGANISM="Durinskia baltica, Strain CSIRO CS-38" /LENGTH=448 /DNA_ID=CAMNT_0010633071 /DNA_START=385 /DNA_END=1731 /DNA_ORIENTATION=-